MLSGFEPNGREITPILKLIDFGEAREVDEKYKNVLFDLGGFSPEASQINVRDVALVSKYDDDKERRKQD